MTDIAYFVPKSEMTDNYWLSNRMLTRKNFNGQRAVTIYCVALNEGKTGGTVYNLNKFKTAQITGLTTIV